MKMIVMVDGKKIEVQNDIRVIYTDVIIGETEDESVLGDLQVVLTHEGMITDIFDSDGKPADLTSALEVNELVEMCY